MKISKIRIKVFSKQLFLGVLAFILAGSITISPLTQTVNAQQPACDTQFYESQTILFHNPCEQFSVCSASAPGGATTISSLNGATNREKTFNYWIAQGLTPAQAAGITGSLAHEGGHSPFRQETSQSWPAGGWGIAQFTGGQRAAATEYVRNAIGSDLFNQYYKAQYGGSITEANGFIPAGVTEDVNDEFLLEELNYLVNYTGGFAPSTISIRVNRLANDWNLNIGSGVKLLDYIKSLESANDVAIAWTYLYEYPADIKKTSGDRGVSAEALLVQLSGEASTDSNSEACGAVGAGGLNFEQSVRLMEHYLVHRADNGDLGWYNTRGYIYQCTAFTYWFVTKFSAGSYRGNGNRVVANLLAGAPSAYNAVTADSLQPYTIFSAYDEGGNGAPGHTGIILGVQPDGSFIIGESNIGNLDWKKGSGGLRDTKYIEDPLNINSKPRALLVSHWDSIDDWFNTFPWQKYELAAPTDAAGTAKKVQDYMGSI